MEKFIEEVVPYLEKYGKSGHVRFVLDLDISKGKISIRPSGMDVRPVDLDFRESAVLDTEGKTVVTEEKPEPKRKQPRKVKLKE